jgi:TonB family protein
MTITTLQRENVTRRKTPRFAVAVPVDIVVLRSGIPASIPGRSLDVSEGGMAAVLAGEVQPGESVGVEFKLPFVSEPVQAKATVRHYGPMRCGLEFLAMPPEQLGALQTWAAVAADAARGGTRLGPQLVTKDAPSQKSAAQEPQVEKIRVRKRLRRLRVPKSRKWIWIVVAIIALTLIIGIWRWVSGWRELEPVPAGASARPVQPRLKVPGSVMEQRVVHKVDPVYPQAAEKLKLRGLVLLDTIVGSDGVVKDLHPISGPDPLARAAMESVRWWRFAPYQLDGKTVPVETTIEVEFRLSE